MKRRSFLKKASAATFTAAISRALLASAPAGKPRIAFGGIGIESSTYSRIRARMVDFSVLTGDALANSERFAFLKKYPVPFLPAVFAAATPGGPVASPTYAPTTPKFLNQLNT